MTVSELLNRIDSRELTEWFAFYQVEASDTKTAYQKAKQGSSIKSQVRGRRR